MLSITVPDTEMFNEATQQFYVVKGCTLQLEHSLVSLAKWESKWKKPFLGTGKKTQEETLDYIRCMTITQNVNPFVYRCLTNENLVQIREYIDDSMTATTINHQQKRTTNREILTAEIIYYYMIALNIPFECQKWHLNRLFMLIRVCSIKNSKQKKMSKSDYFSHRRALNEKRKKELNTHG